MDSVVVLVLEVLFSCEQYFGHTHRLFVCRFLLAGRNESWTRVFHATRYVPVLRASGSVYWADALLDRKGIVGGSIPSAAVFADFVGVPAIVRAVVVVEGVEVVVVIMVKGQSFGR